MASVAESVHLSSLEVLFVIFLIRHQHLLELYAPVYQLLHMEPGRFRPQVPGEDTIKGQADLLVHSWHINISEAYAHGSAYWQWIQRPQLNAICRHASIMPLRFLTGDDACLCWSKGLGCPPDSRQAPGCGHLA